MITNQNVIKGKWLHMKGEFQKMWGNVSDSDLSKTKGDLKSIRGLLQQQYGIIELKSKKIWKSFLKQFDSKKEVVVAEIKNSIKPDTVL